MKTLLFVVAGFAGGAYAATMLYPDGTWWFWGGVIGGALGWVFSGVGESKK